MHCSTLRNIPVIDQGDTTPDAPYHREVSEIVHVLVRVWLPDRPGALGLVASRIGAVEGDIVGIDVLEHGGGVAVDEFAVELHNPSALNLLVREIEEVDGASVEEVRVVEHFPDPRLDALESASRLCNAPTVTALHETFVAEIRAEFLADWSALLTIGQVLASSGQPVPDPCVLEALDAGTAGVTPRRRRHDRPRRSRGGRVAVVRGHAARGSRRAPVPSP